MTQVNPGMPFVNAAQPKLVLRFSNGRVAPFAGRNVVGRMKPEKGADYTGHIVLRDDSHKISRQHFEFGTTSKNRAWIMDLGSSNGTWLIHRGMSIELKPNVKVVVIPGDSIRLGAFHADVCIA